MSPKYVFILICGALSAYGISEVHFNRTSGLNSQQILDCVDCVLRHKIFAVYPFELRIIHHGCFSKGELVSENSPYVTLFYAERTTECRLSFTPKIFFNGKLNDTDCKCSKLFKNFTWEKTN